MARLQRAPGLRSAGSALLVALLCVAVMPLPGGTERPDRPAPVSPDAPEPVPHDAQATATIDEPDGITASLLVEQDAASRPGPTPDAPADAPGPSTAYEQAMAHAADPADFAPGDLVTVGFKPRADDGWPVDGSAPVDLPAGRVTGRDMAASAQDSTWAQPGAGEGPRSNEFRSSGAGAAPGDASGAAPGSVVPADLASWMPPVTDAGGSSPDPAKASGLRRQVFGFLPYWELSNASRKLNYDVLSTIAYFSVGATETGSLRKKNRDGSATTGWAGWTSRDMTRVINAAHARGTRVVLTVSVFAWTSSQAAIQRSLLGSSAARATLARQVAAAVRDRGADGVNLDFEPLAAGYESQFVALLRSLRTQLDRVRKGYQLTYDTTGFAGNYPLEASVAKGAADAVFVMGYDYRTGGSARSGSIAPLSGASYDLADTIRSYTSRVSPNKVILGLPWYGRAWSTASSAPRARNRSGAKYGYSTAVNYESLTSLIAKYGSRWDSVEQSPYIAYRKRNCTATHGCVTTWRQVWYDDARSTKARLAMVNDYGLRGAGIWALGYDGGHPELYRAFAESFLVDKAAPQAGIAAVGAVQHDEGFVVRWSATDVSRIVSYDVQVSTDGGAWVDWLKGTKATSDVFLGRDGHAYAFRVRARDARGNTGSYQTTKAWTAAPKLARGGFGRVVRDGLAYRSGPGTRTVALGTLRKGTIVAITSGPVRKNGLTWYEVTQPIVEWSPVSFVERGVWIATSGAGRTYVKPYRSPSTTRVDAVITGLALSPAGPSGVGSGTSGGTARTISPNHDGNADGLRIRWTSRVSFDTLTLRIFRSTGSLVGSVRIPAKGKGARGFTWDGTVGGRRVPDGRYLVQLVGTAAGTRYTAPSTRPVTGTQLARYAVTVDTVAPRIRSASASASTIAPKGHGKADTVRLALRATGASGWTLTITPAAGGPSVRTASGKGSSASVTWNGRNDAGARVADGRYTAVLAAWDAAGNRASRSFPITVDSTGPEITATVSPGVFSPNGDGALETATLGWTSSEKATGTARIYRGSTLVRSWSVKGAASWSTRWNGRAASGAKVADGRYTFRVSLRDALGNRRTVSTRVIVDRTAARLRWSATFYPQDGDALDSASRLSWTLARDATTTLRLYDASGKLVRTVWTGRKQRAGSRRWTWDGRLADGSYAPQGRYVARLTVTSGLGSTVLERPVDATAFAISPSATKVKTGRTLTVTIRSAERLSTRPVVRFAQPGRRAVKVTATRLASGDYRASLAVRSGPSGTAAITVSAKDVNGGSNVSSTTVTIRR